MPVLGLYGAEDDLVPAAGGGRGAATQPAREVDPLRRGGPRLPRRRFGRLPPRRGPRDTLARLLGLLAATLG